MEFDRKKLPYPLVGVTAGAGGDSILIKGSEKNALYDCGMACFQKGLIENIEKALNGQPLDFVILSHSHYDHIGALPYILKRWPNTIVCAAEKIKQVFGREGAVNLMRSMGQSAAVGYGLNPDEIIVDGLRVDRVLENGDVVDLGEEKVIAFETKGHTDCSMSFLVQPEGILLASESTGVYDVSNHVHSSILKGFEQSMESARFLKTLPYKYIIIPHYGVLPQELNDKYFDMYIDEAGKEKQLILDCANQGMNADEIFEEHKKVFYNAIRKANHPYRAYKMNTEIMINLILNGK